jgi:hypothetical protein
VKWPLVGQTHHDGRCKDEKSNRNACKPCRSAKSRSFPFNIFSKVLYIGIGSEVDAFVVSHHDAPE